jgi:hypothetical protein
MNTQQILHRIRIQLKFSRVNGVRSSLIRLLDEHTGSDHEAEILDVFALEFLKSINDYKSAAPLLRRLLSLDISNQLRQRASEFLLECEKNEKIVPSQPRAQNSQFVEFIEFIRSERLFNSVPSPQTGEKRFVVNDLAAAQKLAWHQSIEKPFASWNGLRTQTSKQVYNYYFANKLSMDLIDDQISAEIMILCERSIPKGLMDFFDDIYGDLVEIARGKLAEITTDLHKLMWEAYQNDLFPCGWEGTFPLGRLCVYTPEE